VEKRLDEASAIAGAVSIAVFFDVPKQLFEDSSTGTILFDRL
jgi:hypothetical protein